MKEIEKFKHNVKNCAKLKLTEVKLSITSANKLAKEIEDLQKQIEDLKQEPPSDTTKKKTKVTFVGDKF